MTRRELLVSAAALAALPSSGAGARKPLPASARNRRPYGAVDWATCRRIVTTSHGHCTTEKHLSYYLQHGFGLLAASNYYPSAPWKPPKGWVPSDVLQAPNAEHHSFYLDNGKLDKFIHLCAPGSSWTSGDKKNGCNLPWRTAIDKMLAALVCPDGGGVTINHPTWTNLDRALMLEMLDYDPRVLGCEVMENGHNSECYWDWALSTGRQCYGFFVPDWGYWQKDFGANVLLVGETTIEACLKAYRQGNFYGSLHALDELRFTKIAFDGKILTAETDKLAKFQVITARGVVQETTGRAVTWSVPKKADWTGPGVEVFARVKAFATDGTGEILWSQPFMLT